MRRATSIVSTVVLVSALGAGPALACAALIGPDGFVRVQRTTTLAAYHDGVEHYVTSFEFAGGGAEFGAIVPLPGIPTEVEKGGDWTLQRLVREVTPVTDEAVLLDAAGASAAREAVVLQEVEIDALDVTILEGGGDEVGRWAEEQGFLLTPDFPEILDFYASRSPIFMAARYDVSRARDAGQEIGSGTPVHLTIPTDNPWVPLRVLGAGAAPDDRIEADLFLLTDREPALLPAPRRGLERTTSEPASDLLLADLGGDENSSWVPEEAWLTHLRLDLPARDLDFDLAVDAWGTGQPSAVDAGLAPALRDVSVAAREAVDPGPGLAAGVAVALAGVGLAAGTLAVTRRMESR